MSYSDNKKKLFYQNLILILINHLNLQKNIGSFLEKRTKIIIYVKFNQYFANCCLKHCIRNETEI